MRCAIALVLLTASVSQAVGQTPEAALVFKDGFVLQGKLVQQKDFLLDPSGHSFVVPKAGSQVYLDDGPRKWGFSPSLLREVLPLKAGEATKEQVGIYRPLPKIKNGMLMPSWTFEAVSDWNENWNRTFKVTTDNGSKFDLTQRLVILTPVQAVIQTVKYEWIIHLSTKELGPEQVRTLLFKHYANQKEMKEPEKRHLIARFLMQAGFPDESEKVINDLVKEYPDSKELVQNLQIAIRKTRVNTFAEDIERAAKNGLHQEAQEKLKQYDREKYDDLASEKSVSAVQEVRNKYEALNEKLKLAKEMIDAIAKRASPRTTWGPAVDAISEGLNFDTVDRLETFLTYAQQHLRDAKEMSKTSQTPEEVLALAIIGWLQGNAAAEADSKLASNMWKAREFVLSYLKTDDEPARQQASTSFSKQVELPLDQLGRIIKMLPPPMPVDLKKIENDQYELQVEVPDAEKGAYLVQVPPDYHHNRQYPVLMLLHGREAAATMMKRWQETAWKQGWVMVAPLWSGVISKHYSHTGRENQFVIDVLRDVRRRFNVDNDRVYLFGWDQGGDMAYDVALSRPGHFAAVSIMCGNPKGFANKYVPNAQYLPFFVVDGSNNGNIAKNNEVHCGQWSKLHYPAILCEYKGRANEWFQTELDTIAEWFGRKRRSHPTKQIGRVGGEEFKTFRDTDNRFYWLGVDGLNDRYTNDWKSWNELAHPAQVQADVALGNEANGKDARIYTQFTIRAKGVAKVNIWLSPEVVDFSKPLQFRMNGAWVRSPTVTPRLQTLLEELYATGDRSFLVYAKVSIGV